jgi:hypothetical protein
MSAVKVVAAACLLFLAGPVFAQEWNRYQNLDDRFAVTAPGQPTCSPRQPIVGSRDRIATQ